MQQASSKAPPFEDPRVAETAGNPEAATVVQPLPPQPLLGGNAPSDAPHHPDTTKNHPTNATMAFAPAKTTTSPQKSVPKSVLALPTASRNEISDPDSLGGKLFRAAKVQMTGVNIHKVIERILHIDDETIISMLCNPEQLQSTIDDALELIRRAAPPSPPPPPQEHEPPAPATNLDGNTRDDPLLRVRARIEAMPRIHPPTVGEHVAASIMQHIAKDQEHILAYAAMDDNDFAARIEELLASMATPNDDGAPKDGERLYHILTKTRPYSTTLTERQASKVVGAAMSMSDKEFSDLLEDDKTQHSKITEIVAYLSILDNWKEGVPPQRAQSTDRAGNTATSTNGGDPTQRQLFKEKCTSCNQDAANGKEKCMKCATRGTTKRAPWEAAMENLRKKAPPKYRSEPARNSTVQEELVKIPGTTVRATPAQALILSKLTTSPNDISGGIQGFIKMLPEFRRKDHREDFDLVFETRNKNTVAHLLPFMEHSPGLMKLAKAASEIVTISDPNGPTLALLKISTLQRALPKCSHLEVQPVHKYPATSYIADVTAKASATGVLETTDHKGRYQTVRSNDPVRKTAFAYPCAAEQGQGAMLTFNPEDELTIKQALWRADIREAYFVSRGKVRLTATNVLLFENALRSIKGWRLHNETTWESVGPDDETKAQVKVRVVATPRDDAQDPPIDTTVLLVPLGEKHLIPHVIEDLSLHHDTAKYRASAVPKFHGYFTALVRGGEKLAHNGWYGRSMITCLTLREAMYRVRNGINPRTATADGEATAPAMADTVAPPPLPSAALASATIPTAVVAAAPPAKKTKANKPPPTPPRAPKPKQTGTPPRQTVPKLPIAAKEARRSAAEKEGRTELGPLPRTAIPLSTNNNRFAPLAGMDGNSSANGKRREPTQGGGKTTPDAKRQATPREQGGGESGGNHH